MSDQDSKAPIENSTEAPKNLPPLKPMLLSAPDSQLDACLFKYIEKWSDTNPPLALDILRILDYSARGGLASGFVMNLLSMYLDEALERENITRQDLNEMAPWRNGIED